MIRCEIGRYEISLTGHAGVGVKGQDIVCSAISTLTQSLGGYLAENTQLLESIDYDEKDGQYYLKVEPTYEAEDTIYHLFEMVTESLKSIEEDYPKAIHVIETA